MKIVCTGRYLYRINSIKDGLSKKRAVLFRKTRSTRLKTKLKVHSCFQGKRSEFETESISLNQMRNAQIIKWNHIWRHMFFRYIRLKKNTYNLPVQKELFNVLTLRQLDQTRNICKISFVLELIKLYLIQSWERRIFAWKFFSRWKLQSIPIPRSDKELNEADFLNSGPQIHFFASFDVRFPLELFTLVYILFLTSISNENANILHRHCLSREHVLLGETAIGFWPS